MAAGHAPSTPRFRVCRYRATLALADAPLVHAPHVDPVVTTVAVLGSVVGAALVALGVLLLVVLHTDPR